MTKHWRRTVAKSRGLPPSFQLKVSAEGLKGPVQLGDYLDEEARPMPQQARARSAQPRRASLLDAEPESKQVLSIAPAKEPEVNFDSEVSEVPRGLAKKPSRKQMNMKADTLSMVDELLLQIQTYSGQKDAKASEMFHALVSALFEARECLDLTTVRPRGKWGSPTARAFPVSLKNAFRAAIAEWTRRNSPRA